MAESFTERVVRVLSEGALSLMSVLTGRAYGEDASALLREVEGQLDQARAELGRVAAGKHLASKQAAEHTRAHERLAEEMRAAVLQEREDLAKVAIGRQLDIEAELRILERSIRAATELEARLGEHVRALSAQRDALNQALTTPRTGIDSPWSADESERALSAFAAHREERSVHQQSERAREIERRLAALRAARETKGDG